MLATATAATTTTNTNTITTPSTPTSKSAWSRGPPRSLSTSSPVAPTAIDGPLTPSPNLDANEDQTSSNDTEPVTPISPAEPPPRPHRNPARKPSIGDTLSPTTSGPGVNNPKGRIDDSPAQGLPTPTTPKWNSLLTYSKPAPPVSTSTPPVLTESKSRSRSRPRDKDLTNGDTGLPNIPMLPPRPAYPPPLPPIVKSTLQADAAPFVPTPMPKPRRPSAAIIIKKPNGEEVDFKQLATPTVFVPASSTAIKIESEAERAKRLGLQVEDLEDPSLPKEASSLTDEPESMVPDGAEGSQDDDDAETVELTSPTSAPARQDSAIDENGAQQLAVPVLATSPPTAPLDSGFPVVTSGPVDVATPAPQGGRRERSRRSSNRADDAPSAEGEVGLKRMTRTRSGRGGSNRNRENSQTNADGTITRTRSGAGERRRPVPGRLDLSAIPRPSALNTGLIANAISNAQMIPDVRKIVYPEQDGVFGPAKELNEGVEDGKFRYDRDFLLQFRGLCNERPHGMAELEEIGLEPAEQQPQQPSRSTRRRRSVRSNTDASLPTPIVTTADGDTLTVPGTPLTATSATEERFNTPFAMPSAPLNPSLPPPAAMNRTGSRGGRSRTGSGNSKPSLTISSTLPPPAFPMTRSISHGSSRAQSSNTASATSLMSPGLPPPTPLDRRSKSLKVRKRSSSTRTDQPSFPASLKSPLTPAPGTPGFSSFMEVKPLEMSANRWTPSTVSVPRAGIMGRTALPGITVETDSLEVVEKKVKGLLNKLTMEKFDTISDQIVVWANKSEMETDGQTLTLVIKLVFDKATDEATWSSMYAKLCRKLMEQISKDITDESVRDKEGRLIAGGQLFRQYLLSRCQADFERGWSARETLEEQQEAVAAASGGAPGEEVFSDEYYALQKAKRRGLGLVKFIGELFKLQMLTERIMHRCILKLLDDPAEEDIESVCQLLKTVGGALSGPKGKESMDSYFGTMNRLSQDLKVSQRIRFMLLDVIDLRSRNWVPKTQVAAPSTLAQVHEAAAKEASEKTLASKPIPILKASSRRGQNRSDTSSQKEGDAWPTSAGGLGRSLNKTSGASLTSTLSSLGDVSKSPTTAKSPTVASMFHPMARPPSEPGSNRMTRMPSEPGKSRSRRGGDANRQMNRRTSVDFVQLDAAVEAGNTGRKRLQLLPRSVATTSGPTEENTTDIPPLAATVEDPPSMTEAQARAKIDEDIKEFMQIHDINEATGYFESLPATYRHLLVDRFASKMDAKETEVALIAELFSRISTSGLCTTQIFEQGFTPTVEALDDISLDVPAAYNVMAKLLCASKLSREAVGRLAGLISIYGSPIVHPRDRLLREFDGAS